MESMSIHLPVCDRVLNNLYFRFSLNSVDEFLTKVHSYWLEKHTAFGNFICGTTTASHCQARSVNFTQFTPLKLCVGSFNTHR